MQQNWSIRSRAHTCAVTQRPFEDGELFHTSVYFDPEENGYVRRDVCAEAWAQEQEQRKPIAAWKTRYQKVLAEAKPEIAPKESVQALLQRFIEEGDPRTENARYILALMLERKRQITQTAEKEVDGAKMLFYENKKTGEIFIVRDPELRLDEIADMQDEVATLLAFGGPAADAAKAVGVTLTVDGVVPTPDPAAPESTPAETEATAEAAAPAEGEEAEEELSDEPETAGDDTTVDDIPEDGTAEDQSLDIQIGAAASGLEAEDTVTEEGADETQAAEPSPED